MATAVGTLAIRETGIHRTDCSPGTTIIPFTITFAAGDYVADGIEVPIAGYAVKTSKAPIDVFLFPANGFLAEYTVATEKVVLFASVGVQLDATALPAGIVSQAIRGFAIFPNS